jgi:hypothetical protein
VAKASPIQNSFNAGELSPQLRGRVDLSKYKNGCETLENFLPQVFGPAQKRPGTRFVRATKFGTQRSRLIPFEFSDTQSFALEFGDEYIRFHTAGGTVLQGSPAAYNGATAYTVGDLVSSGGVNYYCIAATTGNAPPNATYWYAQPASGEYEIPSPYTDTDVQALNFAQSADVIYIAHPDHEPQKLARFGATEWTISAVEFTRPPFNDRNVGSTTLTASATTGNITLTASASLFTTDDVGRFYSIAVIPESFYTAWAASTAITAGAFRQNQGRVYQAANSATTGTRPPLHISGTESDGGVSWTYVGDGTGYVEVTGFTSATLVNATVIQTLPTTSATTRWATAAWSDVDGWPRTVVFYEDRLWFAGSAAKPQTLWASVVGDYENHTYGTNDDDALNFTINTQDLNTINWLSPGKVLAIGTSSGEFTISANQINEAITPTNVRVIPQTTYGSTGTVRPLRVASSTLFVQRAGRKVREYTFSFEIDAYVAPNLTLLSEHITKTGIADMAYQQEPVQVVWTPRVDGTLLGMTYERAEEVVGWHRHDVGGAVESVVALPHWDGDQDALWLIVKRTIDGDDVRYIEYLEKYLMDEYAFFVDCGATYDGVPTTTISGLDFLEGETVAVLADGSVHPNRVVTAGAIELQREASVVNVGLPFMATLKTMPIEAGAQDGIAQGKTQRINNLVMRLVDTGAGLFYGPDTATMDELHVRRTNDEMDNPVPLFTGDTEFKAFPGEYQQGAQITVQHRSPLPCTIVALMPQMNTYDR